MHEGLVVRMMWTLFAPSLRRSLPMKVKHAKADYRTIVRSLPEFDKGDPFLVNILSAALLAAFYRSLPQKLTVEQVTTCYHTAMSHAWAMRYFLKRRRKQNGKARTTWERQASESQTRDNPYSWKFTYESKSDGYVTSFTTCGILKLYQQLGIEEIMPALCSYDFVMASAMGMKFTRNTTLAAGGPCCDGYYHLDGNKAFWQKTARFYGSAMRSSEKLYRAIAKAMVPDLKETMKVLELACGSGQLSFRLAPSVCSWEATDFSPAMIAQCKKQPASPSLHFTVADATSLSYPAGSFDAVVIANALHIMPNPDLALDEIKRVLKPGGVLFAPTFVQGEGKAFLIRIRLMELLGFKTFHRWSEKAFVTFLEQQGWTVVYRSLLGTSLAPLCFVKAVPSENN